jgi:hypothetical protein
MERFNRLCNTISPVLKGERNDCSVKALALACDISYEDAYDEMLKVGRKKNKGAYTRQTLKALDNVGIKYREITPNGRRIRQPNGLKYTVRTIGRDFYAGTYIMTINGHILTMINGVVEDWTQGKLNRVQRLIKIIK